MLARVRRRKIAACFKFGMGIDGSACAHDACVHEPHRTECQRRCKCLGTYSGRLLQRLLAIARLTVLPVALVGATIVSGEQLPADLAGRILDSVNIRVNEPVEGCGRE